MGGIKIKFDVSGNPETPTLILADRSGNKLGLIKAQNIHIKDALTDTAEISFDIYKYLDGKKNPLWDSVKNFKLVWCKEWDRWFEIQTDIDESESTVKSVSCSELGVAELSQINLYDIEINTENDIAREDYAIPTVLYNSEHPEASLLNRIMEKAVHYSVAHVDSTIANIQRTFTFDGVSIYDAFSEIAEEIDCLFNIDVKSDSKGNILRNISVYDLESNCLSCGHRGEFTGSCPKCGSTDIAEGFGNDTTIFITADELASSINFTTDTGSVKNCFKLEAGDELMTATIRNCNPNGSDYLWYFSEDMMSDMSEKLRNKLEAYNKQYEAYQNNYKYTLDSSKVNSYNFIAEKYQKYDSSIESLPTETVGYSSLMTAYYNTIDLSGYLEHELMPNAELDDTTAAEQLALLTAGNLSPIAVANADAVSLATANSAVSAMVKVVIDSRYSAEIVSSSLSGKVWTGSFKVTNNSDEEDTAAGSDIKITISGDYETYIKQKLEKALKKADTDDLSISGLFEKDYSDFCAELKKYCLTSLTSFQDAAQSCIDILVEQNVSDPDATWAGKDSSTGKSKLYVNLYTPYLNKLKAVQAEMKLRQNEIDAISTLQNEIEEAKAETQKALDLTAYLGDSLLSEFCSFRREDKFSNDNYISDGLSNSELFSKALEFIETAEKGMYKSAEQQHSISAKLKNLFVIEKFKPLAEYFEVGNWLRARVDGEVYKLRLVSYEIDYDNLEDLSVEFSDLLKINDGVSDIADVLSKAGSMASSYDYVKRQASQGETGNGIVQGWFEKGLDATNVKIIGNADNQCQTWDSHGMLFREYDSITDSYASEQMKIINSTLAVTDDNWETTKTAIGKFIYVDPESGENITAFGVNGETLVGKLIIGESLGIFNSSGSLKFNGNGLTVTNNKNTVSINPNADSVFTISNSGGTVIGFDDDGNGIFSGKITSTSGSIGGWTISGSTLTSADKSIILNSANDTITINSSDGSYMKVRNGGLTFYQPNNEAGEEIGTIGVTGNTENKTYGLTFNLKYGDAMTWSTYVFNEDGSIKVDENGKTHTLNKVRYTEDNGFVVYNKLTADGIESNEGIKAANGLNVVNGDLLYGIYKITPCEATINGTTIQYMGWEKNT